MFEYIIHYAVELLNWEFTVLTNSEKVCLDVQKLMTMFSEFEVKNRNTKMNTINIYAFDGVYSIEYFGKNRIVDVTDNYQRLIFIIYELILISFEQTKKSVAVFHGAVLSKGEDSIAIMAPTQTGKSSFALNYTTKGFDYMSDDYVLLDTKFQRCISFPKPVAIRNKDFLLKKNMEYLSAINNEGINISLIIPEKYVKVFENKSLKTVLFIERKEQLSASVSVEKMTQAVLFKNLMFSSHVAGEISINRKILNSLQNYRGYKVSYCPGMEIFDKLDICELL